jgi:hypothetical protein
MNAVDKYVIYDDVNYIKGGWINRNNILINGEKKLFTIKLKSASPNKMINEIEIADDFGKFMKTVELNYRKASFYDVVNELIIRIITFEDKRLSEFIANSFKEIISYLNIETTLIISSQIPKNVLLKGQDKVIEICKNLCADTYLNAIGGLELYDKKEFETKGIVIKFLKPYIVPYQQFRNSFVPSLSIIDILMFNSVEEIRRMLYKYELV